MRRKILGILLVAAGILLKADSFNAGSGASGGAITQISSQTLAAPASTITFSSIPNSYNHLRLVLATRSDQATAQTVYMQFNGDTGTNYDREFNTSTGASNAGGIGQQVAAAQVFIGSILPTGATAGAPSTFDITIMYYKNTTFFKSAIISCGNINDGVSMVWCPEWFDWRSTTAITSIVLTASTGNFITGTVATLYGLN